MRSRLLVPLCLLLAAACAAPGDVLRGGATAADREAVLDIVQRTFDALEDNDVEAWRALLLDEGYFTSVRGAPGQRRLGFETFAHSLENPPDTDQHWLERWWEPTVLIDRDVATVWTRYDFHVDGAFSHCGTDVIVMLRTDEGWKIASLVWSVERESCEPSPLGPVTAR